MALAAFNGENRQSKTALFLLCCGCAGASPHWIDPVINLLPAISLAFLLGGYALGVVLRERNKLNENVSIISSDELEKKDWPSVDVLVAAKDEENVVQRLIERLSTIKYPKGKLSVWIIDDGSEDKTPQIAEELIQNKPNFQLLRRSKSAGGGKSGALNYALTKIQGDWLFILDADAQLHEDALMRVIEFANEGEWSAVQLRKSVVNTNQNLLTSMQSMEMAMDAVIQKGRLLVGGVVELRGNGQLIQRSSIDKCGGFNEETVTDDLDLSFRLLIAGEVVGIVWDPPVQEEAVEKFSALLKQRQRWAEGGLQRFFDYWPFLTSHQLSIAKRRDLVCFFLLQYAIPLISLSDIITSILTQTNLVYWPLSFVAFSVSGLAYWKGCRRKSEGPELPKPNLIKLLLAIVYLMHWFVVIPIVTIKMVLLPKSLVWVKTAHKGN